MPFHPVAILSERREHKDQRDQRRARTRQFLIKVGGLLTTLRVRVRQKRRRTTPQTGRIATWNCPRLFPLPQRVSTRRTPWVSRPPAPSLSPRRHTGQSARRQRPGRPPDTDRIQV